MKTISDFLCFFWCDVAHHMNHGFVCLFVCPRQVVQHILASIILSKTRWTGFLSCPKIWSGHPASAFVYGEALSNSRSCHSNLFGDENNSSTLVILRHSMQVMTWLQNFTGSWITFSWSNTRHIYEIAEKSPQTTTMNVCSHNPMRVTHKVWDHHLPHK